MNVSSVRCIVPFAFAFFALLAIAAAPAQQITIAEQLFPGAVDGDRGPLLKRLVDDLTGEPLAGAEVFLVLESKTPIGGEFWWSYRGTSDADGFVRIDRPNGDRDWHILVARHPRNGVAVSSAKGELVWRLGRGQDVPVRIVDWLGRPAAGARVGFCGYCGHTPDVATAQADAQGLAVLRGIDPRQQIADLYVQYPGLGLFYDSIGWRPGDPTALVPCEHSPEQTGRVLDHEGRPVAGAFVCGGGRHRGPWAKTKADGSYSICGAEAGESVHKIVLPGREFYCDAARFVPSTLRLPATSSNEPREAVVEPASDPEIAPVSLRTLRVVVVGAPAAAGEVMLSALYVGKDRSDDAEAAYEVQVPAQGPFVLVARIGPSDQWVRREFPFVDGAPADGQVRVVWLAEPVVRGRCVDADGKPCAALVRWLPSDDVAATATDADGTFVLAVRNPERFGTRWGLFEVKRPQDPCWRVRHLRLPEAGSPDLDLGRVLVAAPAPLVVVDEKGLAPADAKVGFVREGWHTAGEPEDAPLQPDGSWFGAELRAGDAIVVDRDGCVPFRTVLHGGGPWRLELPDADLALAVVDASGQPLEASVVLGDHDERSRDGTFVLRGLRPGRQRVHVGAPGHRSAIVDVDAAAAGDGERAPLRIVLPAR